MNSRTTQDGVNARSFRVSFSEAGACANSPIVFLHGMRLNRHIWDQHARLLQHDFRVITLDLPGHGTLIDVPLTEENANRQLLYIIEDVLRQPPVIVGYSLGGFVAMNFIERYPEHTSGLLLVGATLNVTGWKRIAYELLIAAQMVIPCEMYTRMLASFFRLTLPRELAETINSTPFNRDVFEQSQEMVCGIRFSKKLRGYPNPALFITGQFDLVFRPEQGQFAKQCGAQSRVIRWTDHVLPLRRPHQFCDVVRDFAKQLETRREKREPGRMPSPL